MSKFLASCPTTFSFQIIFWFSNHFLIKEEIANCGHFDTGGGSYWLQLLLQPSLLQKQRDADCDFQYWYIQMNIESYWFLFGYFLSMYICTVQQLYDFQKANQQKRCKCRSFFKLMAVLASPLSILQEPGSRDAILKSETM